MVGYGGWSGNGFRHSVARLIFTQAVLKNLSDVVFKADAERLMAKGESFIEGLGCRSGALSFRARDLVLTTQELFSAAPDQPVPLNERKLLFQEPR